MLDLRAPLLPPDQGERLVREAYKRDFRLRDAQIRDGASWKLERRQHFQEQGSASWEAMRRGDWEESLRLLEERRPALLEAARADERRGYVFHRVRIVQNPLTPYMQWQLHSLRLRAECGEMIRVVRLEEVSVSDNPDPLPEVVILGGHTLYRVLYDEAGVPGGAVRYTAPETVTRWELYVKALHRAGEEVRSFFDREVAPLPPPEVTGQQGTPAPALPANAQASTAETE
ncbi:hypothetical protein LHJ74_13965 [Streptomyces sp. N2-109]|uniref:DUF6879 domain-containing protein n=1 Tax=Streptomyces gossypii TaxID=2883101 RepID=A0ABT2JSZ0_9ACTN|nr:DUF6879 family protein [Streptomyces gossypii]MCT2591002.1 hypothetical protein [Streptomyces gossypii]